ncbi:MAG: YgeY family selenium metabolism-linked hydrolase [Candidatus Bathyarchaeota archaeon]|nr:YgeY family selenium metabolism-linked hydrolase [Candidatus Bathyarchaeota archaeon]
MKDVIHCARRFVQIPSLSGDEKELAFFVKGILNEFGLDKVYIDELGDVIGLVKGRSLRPLVVLEGHMDHVSPGNLELWKCQPYSAEMINGNIFGRGAVDMKASLAAMTFAAKEVSSKEHEGTLVLCFVVHEETVEGTAIGHIIEKEIRGAPDLVVLGEATNLDLGIGHRGRAVVNVELSGRTAHASMPELGLNALHAASKLISYVEEELNPNLPFHQKLGKATIATISLGASPKVGPQIPDRSKILFDRRTILRETENEILKPIKDKVDELVGRGTVLNGATRILEEDIKCWTGRKLRTKDFFPSWLIKETGIVQKALKSLWKSGFHANTHVWKFSTDGVYTYGLRRIPTVGIGPGDEALAHQPNEHVRVRDVEKAVQAYVAIVESLIS